MYGQIVSRRFCKYIIRLFDIVENRRIVNKCLHVNVHKSLRMKVILLFKNCVNMKLYAGISKCFHQLKKKNCFDDDNNYLGSCSHT